MSNVVPDPIPSFPRRREPRGGGGSGCPFARSGRGQAARARRLEYVVPDPIPSFPTPIRRSRGVGNPGAARGWMPAPRSGRGQAARARRKSTSFPRRREPRGGAGSGCALPDRVGDRLRGQDGWSTSFPRRREPRGGGSGCPLPDRVGDRLRGQDGW